MLKVILLVVLFASQAVAAKVAVHVDSANAFSGLGNVVIRYVDDQGALAELSVTPAQVLAQTSAAAALVAIKNLAITKYNALHGSLPLATDVLVFGAPQ